MSSFKNYDFSQLHKLINTTENYVTNAIFKVLLSLAFECKRSESHFSFPKQDSFYIHSTSVTDFFFFRIPRVKHSHPPTETALATKST